MSALLLVTALSSFVLSLLLVAIVRWYAIRRDVLDHPNERSSHVQATPRGGGVGAITTVLAVFGVASWRGPPQTGIILALGGVALATLVGWIDDHGGVSVRQRLMAHVAAGVLIAPLAIQQQAGPPWLLAIVAAWWVFVVVSSINVVNFIDGIDGMIGLQALVLGVNICLLSTSGGLSTALGVSLAGAAVGFLVWNWAPARVFLGDSGSGGLGALFVTTGLLLAVERAITPVEALLPLFPIFLDASVTLLIRAVNREGLTEAHRSHLYQRLANGGLGHSRVSLLFAAASALAIPVSVVAARSSDATSWALMASYAGISATGYWVLDRGARRRSASSNDSPRAQRVDSHSGR